MHLLLKKQLLASYDDEMNELRRRGNNVKTKKYVESENFARTVAQLQINQFVFKHFDTIA